jgi:peptidyl-prolyl cis-trans isomerase C
MAAMTIGALAAPGAGQQPSSSAPVDGSVPPGQIAAVVNGQPIYENAVQRALKRVPPAKYDEARPEILNFLIDNLLIDQRLAQMHITVEPKDVDAKMKEVTEEVKKEGATFDKMMRELMLTDAELRAQIAAQLRWDQFAATQATEKALRELFEANRDMFDGTAVRARHILLMPPRGDAKANADAKSHLLAIKKQIEDGAAQELAKLPPQTDGLTRQKARGKVMEEAFAAIAAKESACPSKAQGGDLGWFPRAGSMVEPFAKAAFVLQPYQLSEVVTTPFGHHLILVTDRRPGQPIKFEQVKEEVREVYLDRLREGLCVQLRPSAKIVINPVPHS